MLIGTRWCPGIAKLVLSSDTKKFWVYDVYGCLYVYIYIELFALVGVTYKLIIWYHQFWGAKSLLIEYK
jgi:hypothetical protein